MYGVAPIASMPIGAARAYVSPAAAASVPEPAWWLSSRYGDAATLTASSVEGVLVAANLQDRRPEKKYRATGTYAKILIDLGRPVDCSDLSLGGHNLTNSGCLRVCGAATVAALDASPVFASGWVSAWPITGKHREPDWPVEISIVRWPRAGSLRYWQLEMSDPGNPDGYVEAGRLMIGQAFQPRFSVDLNFGVGLISPDERSKSPFGRTYSDDRGPPSRRFSLALSAASGEDIKRGLFELQRYCGLARDLVFSLDPAATTDFYLYTLQAEFENDAAFEAQPFWDPDGQVWRTSLNLIEVL